MPERQVKPQDILQMMSEGLERGPKPQRPLPEAQVMELREACRHFGTPASARFKPGDLVTPVKSAAYDNGGDPHLVLEVRAEPIPHVMPIDSREAFATSYWPRQDMRVAVIKEGRETDFCVAAFWVESWVFEEWSDAV